jgi:hypothetical protein
MGVACVVTRAPANAADTLDVQWRSPRDGDQPEELAGERGARWTRRGSTLPAVGDEALLLVDSQGDPWVIAW